MFPGKTLKAFPIKSRMRQNSQNDSQNYYKISIQYCIRGASQCG
jgi:hypothetical protein